MKTIKHDECWLYAGVLDTVQGYGLICANGKVYRAHRVVYENLVGEIEPYKVVDHLCRVVSCINPEHLEVVSDLENKMRGMSPAAQNARKTHCSKGHTYTPENTTISKKGWRECRRCRIQWDINRRAKLK